MKKIFSIAMAILIVFTAAMTAEGERLTTPEELGKIKKAADVPSKTKTHIGKIRDFDRTLHRHGDF